MLSLPTSDPSWAHIATWRGWSLFLLWSVREHIEQETKLLALRLPMWAFIGILQSQIVPCIICGDCETANGFGEDFIGCLKCGMALVHKIFKPNCYVLQCSTKHSANISSGRKKIKGTLQGRVMGTSGSCKLMQAPEICAFQGLETSELPTNNQWAWQRVKVHRLYLHQIYDVVKRFKT